VHSHSGWRNSMHALHPTDFPSAIHSLPYNIAAAVADREFSWRHAFMEKITDPTIGLLQERVRLKVVPRHGAALRGGTVTITAKDGKEYSSTVDWPKGSPPRGIRWADVDAKYRALLPSAKLPSKKIEQSLRLIHELDKTEKVSELTALLDR
jgi:2-methylcitrate dehydratase PrpD